MTPERREARRLAQQRRREGKEGRRIDFRATPRSLYALIAARAAGLGKSRDEVLNAVLDHALRTGFRKP